MMLYLYNNEEYFSMITRKNEWEFFNNKLRMVNSDNSKLKQTFLKVSREIYPIDNIKS